MWRIAVPVPLQQSVIQIRQSIMETIKTSICPVYSVLADEATDCSNKEQIPIVLRHVDANKEINEHFVKFVECDDGMTGEALAKNVKDTLDDIGLPLSRCCGQGYGASAMSSEVKGVSGLLLKIQKIQKHYISTVQVIA